MGCYLLLIEETEKAFSVYIIFRIMDFLSAFVQNIFSLSMKQAFYQKAPLAPNTTL